MPYYEDREDEVIRPEPVVVPTPTPEPEAKEETAEDDMSDLFEVKGEDVSDLADVSEETTVTEEDVMGEDEEATEVPDDDDMADLFEVGQGNPERTEKPRRFKRTTRRYEPPLGGVRGINR